MNTSKQIYVIYQFSKLSNEPTFKAIDCNLNIRYSESCFFYEDKQKAMDDCAKVNERLPASAEVYFAVKNKTAELN